MSPSPHLLGTLALRLGAAASEALLAVAVRGVLRPLPAPAAPSVPPAGGDRLDALWRALAALPPPARRESAFQSTARVVKRDVWRKQADQVPGRAGRGATPAGWEDLAGVATEPGRPPLHGLLRPPRDDGRVAIVVHGLYDSPRSRYVRVAGEWLARQGLGVLQPDMRWHGRLYSREWLPTLGLEEAGDLAAWARWLRGRWGARPVTLVGFSLGALAVVQALARPDAGDLFAGGVVFSPPGALPGVLAALDAPPRWRTGLEAVVPLTFQGLLAVRMARLGIDGGARGRFRGFLDWLAPRVGEGGTADELLARADPLPALARCRRPLVLVSSLDDPVLPAPIPAGRGGAVPAAPTVLSLHTGSGGHIGHFGTHPEWCAELLSRVLHLAPGA
ncbi:MAG TPA: alpha/beta hydrolase [Thermoanaerobaculia bacterium]|nr:alpha/beta hydrolase [Thermoanaerobaculia bacterium]